MIIHVDLGPNSYDVVVEAGLLGRIGQECNLNRRVLVVTDSGVPAEYAECVAAQCKEGHIVTIEQGEQSKNLENFARLEQAMLDYGFTRKDCVVAVGGGVVGDLSGFAASCFMRGIDFYNCPTTVLSQVDSSIGGKTAIDFGGVKNIVGSFYQPKKVIIDTDTLKTLSPRLISNGLVEAIKMACTFDKALLGEMETGITEENMVHIIASSIDLKRKVVEEDEKEAGLRKVLNFGHTLGHGVEVAADGELLHGESVALGMLFMCEPEVKEQLIRIFGKLNLPRTCSFDIEKAIEAVAHDKKSKGGAISTVYVEKAGTFTQPDMTLEELRGRLVRMAEEY